LNLYADILGESDEGTSHPFSMNLTQASRNVTGAFTLDEELGSASASGTLELGDGITIVVA